REAELGIPLEARGYPPSAFQVVTYSFLMIKWRRGEANPCLRKNHH
ncbi:MAG: hypothetical protein ACI9MB_001929, partial [Verrucomicrobiales bacterium]